MLIFSGKTMSNDDLVRWGRWALKMTRGRGFAQTVTDDAILAIIRASRPMSEDEMDVTPPPQENFEVYKSLYKIK